MVRMALALFLAAHGIAHLVGFLVPWRLLASEEAPYRTTLFAGSVDVGDAGIRLVGLAWLILAAAFVAGGVAVVTGQAWATRWVLYVSAASLVACLAGWPDARIGVWVNLIILLAAVAVARGWVGGPAGTP